MMYNRFKRDYELKLETLNGETIKIIPPLRISFEANKSISAGLNDCTVKIYNLSETHRKQLIKDREENVKLSFELACGYSKLGTIFKGDIAEAYTERKGSDFITTVVSQEGVYDFKNSFTSRTVSKDAVNFIISDMKNTSKGKITTQEKLLRPQVLVGNSAKLIEERLAEDETYFISEDKIYILKTNEVIDDFIPLVTSSTGLLKTPTKALNEITFSPLLNPDVKIGRLIKLETDYDTRLNGQYKVQTIKYTCDYDGKDWKQEIQAYLNNNAKVL